MTGVNRFSLYSEFGGKDGLFLEAAVASGELGQGRDVIALSKLVTTIDEGLAIYGIVSPSKNDTEAIVGQLDALLGPTPIATPTS